MKRIVYYVIHATSKENQDGIFHYSKPFERAGEAVLSAKRQREILGNNDGHVAVEKHYEVYEHNEWRIDHDAGGSEHVLYL